MKPIATLLATTALAGLVGVASIAPVIAQDARPGAEAPQAFTRMDRPERPGRDVREQRVERSEARRGGFPLLNLVCAPNGAEQLEVALVRVSYQLELTEEQATLFEDFRTSALTAQSDLSQTCGGETAPAEDADLIDRLDFRTTVLAAQLEALETVTPAFEAFYGALTDEQKALLEPGARGHGPRGHFGPRGMMGDDSAAPVPDAPPAAEEAPQG